MLHHCQIDHRRYSRLHFLVMLINMILLCRKPPKRIHTHERTVNKYHGTQVCFFVFSFCFKVACWIARNEDRIRPELALSLSLAPRN